MLAEFIGDVSFLSCWSLILISESLFWGYGCLSWLGRCWYELSLSRWDAELLTLEAHLWLELVAVPWRICHMMEYQPLKVMMDLNMTAAVLTLATWSMQFLICSMICTHYSVNVIITCGLELNTMNNLLLWFMLLRSMLLVFLLMHNCSGYLRYSPHWPMNFHACSGPAAQLRMKMCHSLSNLWKLNVPTSHRWGIVWQLMDRRTLSHVRWAIFILLSGQPLSLETDLFVVIWFKFGQDYVATFRRSCAHRLFMMRSWTFIVTC